MNTKYCDRCGNPDCPRVSPKPYWRVCPHASAEELASQYARRGTP